MQPSHPIIQSPLRPILIPPPSSLPECTPPSTAPDPPPPSRDPNYATKQRFLARTVLHQPADLPEGYEMRTTQQGQIYFHHLGSGASTWHDPRIPRDIAGQVVPAYQHCSQHPHHTNIPFYRVSHDTGHLEIWPFIKSGT